MSSTQNPLNCTLCDDPAEELTSPPLCARHNDLSLLVDFLQAKGQSLTLRNAELYLKAALVNGGEWTLSVEDLPDLLPAYLEKMKPELEPA